MDYRIKVTLTKIDNDLAQRLTIPELAASINVSVTHFQRLFKKEMQICALKYIKNRRLEASRRLLETTHLRVKEIRVKVGSTNEAHFLHDFKQKFGMTPCDYRRKILNERNG